MTGRLRGKVAFVTAAAQGIGRAAALAMHAEGARVWATDVQAGALAELAAAGLQTRVLDVTDAAAIDAARAAAGPVDVLFNCAGMVADGTVLDGDESDWDLSFELNVKSMYRTCRAFLPAMLERGGGSIVNMASMASSIKGFPRRCAYGATKAAVIGLTKAIAADYVTRGIRCNAVCPGTVDTPSLRGRIAAAPDPVAAEKAFIARQPMGRLATVEDIVPVIVYLASDESKFVTGQALSVDGGVTI
ncbi:MAG TPA: SDR family oxidoreductase [Burkholderiaceae bacterium]|nr:SDR family oxidoreductase [Burkholderiaceae bacterium]